MIVLLRKRKGMLLGKGSPRDPDLHWIELLWAFCRDRKGKIGELNNKGWSGDFSLNSDHE